MWQKVARVLGAVGAFIVLLFVPFLPVLAFEHEHSGNVLAYLPAKEGTAFEIKYIHSIHLSPVVESYHVEGTTIVQDQLTYEEYGVGMPSGAESGEQFAVVDGAYVIRSMNRVFEEIDMRVARVTASQEILTQGKTMAFTTFTEPGSWIRMKVTRIPVWTMIKGVNVLE